MAGSQPFGPYSNLAGEGFVSGHYNVDDERTPTYMTGHLYNPDQLYVETTLQINTGVPPIITTPAADDAFDDYLQRSMSASCSPSPYSAEAPYNTGLRGFHDLSDPESPHSASGSEPFSGRSPVDISPVNNNGLLLPVSSARSHHRTRSASDVRLSAHQEQDYSSGLLSPQPMPGHRRTRSYNSPNPQMYDQYPGGTEVLFGSSPSSLHPENPFGSYRGRPLSRNSSNGSARSSRRPSPYGSVASTPAGGSSDLDLPLVDMKLKEEDDVQYMGTQPTQDINVVRPDVTTAAIKNASGKRREKPAPFRCDICGSDFTRKANLIGHITAHKGERPFKCESHGCAKAFARLNDLKRHQKIHDKDQQLAS